MATLDDETAVRDLTTRLAAAETAADLESTMALFTDDAMLMDPEIPLLHGAEEIRSFYEGVNQHARMDVSAVAEEVQVLGPWAYIRMSASVTATSKADGKSQDFTGKGIWIAKKQDDGSWKLYRTVFNTDSRIDPS